LIKAIATPSEPRSDAMICGNAINAPRSRRTCESDGRVTVPMNTVREQSARLATLLAENGRPRSLR